MNGTNEGKPMTLKDLTKELMEWNTSPITLARAIVDVLQDQQVTISALDLIGSLRYHAGYKDLNRDELSSILSSLHYEPSEIQNACCRVFPTRFRVDANLPWQSTGLYIKQGDFIAIKYLSGKWTFNPAESSCGPEGSRRYIAKEGYALPGKNEGALIGKIGDHVFCVNTAFDTQMTWEGELQFTINDDLNSKYGGGLSDNSGSIEVEIEIRVN